MLAARSIAWQTSVCFTETEIQMESAAVLHMDSVILFPFSVYFFFQFCFHFTNITRALAVGKRSQTKKTFKKKKKDRPRLSQNEQTCIFPGLFVHLLPFLFAYAL